MLKSHVRFLHKPPSILWINLNPNLLARKLCKISVWWLYTILLVWYIPMFNGYPRVNWHRCREPMRNPPGKSSTFMVDFPHRTVSLPSGNSQGNPPCPGGHDFRHLCLFEVFPTLLQRQLPGQWGVGTGVTTIGSAHKFHHVLLRWTVRTI